MARRLRHKLLPVADQIVHAYRNDATLREIAEFFGCAPGTVRNLLIAKGEELRPKGRRPKILPEIVLDETPTTED